MVHNRKMDNDKNDKIKQHAQERNDDDPEPEVEDEEEDDFDKRF